LAKRFADEQERLAKMEEDERLRMKALREGVETTTDTVSTGFVRVVKKKSDEVTIPSAEEIAEKTEKGEKKIEKKESDQMVEDLDLPTRTKNALVNAGLTKVSDLSGKSEKEIAEIKGVSAASAKLVVEVIK